MSRSAPVVSVTVPTYNYARFLPAMCRSLQAQTFQDFEVLIGDDGSTDDTCEVLKPFLADERFRLISWNPNRGLTAGVLALVEAVRGEFYCTMAGDDEWEPEFLQARVQLMREHPHVAMVHGRTKLIDEQSMPLPELPEYGDLIANHRAMFSALEKMPNVMPSADALRLLLNHNLIGATSVMLRTSASRRVAALLHMDWVYATDWAFWLLHIATGGDLAYDPRPLTRYRVHGSSLSFSPEKMGIRLCEQRLVPLWALSSTAHLSMESAQLWTRWRTPLYALWLRRALQVKRQGTLQDKFLQLGAVAFYGRSHGRVNLWIEALRHSFNILRYGAQENAARRQQFGQPSGLGLIKHPFFQINS